MKRTSRYLAATVLAWLLMAAPARADLAAPAPGGDSTIGPAADAIDQALTAGGLSGSLDFLYATIIPPISDSSLLAAVTQSTSPMASYYTTVGPDTSQPGSLSFPTLSGGSPTFAIGAAAISDRTPGEPPSLVTLASGAQYVGSGSTVGTADAANAMPSPTMTLSTVTSITPSEQTPVPLPPSLFLLGSGLFGLLRMRPSLRRAV